MALEKARPTTRTKSPTEIAIEIFVEGQTTSAEMVTEPAPEGFPTDLLHHLADFMARGFNAAQARQLEELFIPEAFATSLSGRPIDDATEEEARKAAELHEKNPKLTWGRIARAVCRNRVQAGHHCRKHCADRIRQSVNAYRVRREVNDLRIID